LFRTCHFPLDVSSSVVSAGGFVLYPRGHFYFFSEAEREKVWDSILTFMDAIWCMICWMLNYAILFFYRRTYRSNFVNTPIF